MSKNEGNFDSVHADDAAVVSVGAMQETVDESGKGELWRQVADFKETNPDKYEQLFASKGWKATDDGLHWQDPTVKDPPLVTGAPLQDLLQGVTGLEVLVARLAFAGDGCACATRLAIVNPYNHH